MVPGPAGVAIRDRLRVSESDAAVLAEVGMFLGSLAAGDLAERSRQGLAHDAASWAARKQGLTGTRHDAASIAVARRALGHPIRLGAPPSGSWGRTAPPPAHQSDVPGHRTVQARPEIRRREETRPHLSGPRTGCAPPGGGAKAGHLGVPPSGSWGSAQNRSGHAAEHAFWHQDSLPLSL
nr:hypothetical protein [Streptomyces ureilyticus]